MMAFHAARRMPGRNASAVMCNWVWVDGNMVCLRWMTVSLLQRDGLIQLEYSIKAIERMASVWTAPQRWVKCRERMPIRRMQHVGY
jgi:hypothetical protein